MGPFAPFSATIQALSRTRAFLLSENGRKLLCMGRTPSLSLARPYLLNNCPFQLSFSWESNPARVKASGRGAKCYPREEYQVQILKIFIPHTNNGGTPSNGLVGTPDSFGNKLRKGEVPLELTFSEHAAEVRDTSR
jgi:hypothetical protein